MKRLLNQVWYDNKYNNTCWSSTEDIEQEPSYSVGNIYSFLVA